MSGPTYESMEMLGMAADTLDNLYGALQLPIPAQMHVEQMKAQLPLLRDKLRAIYVIETGDNPWESA